MSLSFVAFASCEDDKNNLSENVKSLIGKTYQGYDDDLELQVTLIFDETSFSLYENYTLMGKGTYSESKGLVVLTFKAGDYKGIEEYERQCYAEASVESGNKDLALNLLSEIYGL